MKIGFVGLGKMGKNMVLRLLERDIQVVAWNRSPEPVKEVVAAGAESAQDLDDLLSKLPSPKIVWVMLPSGEITEQYINQLSTMMQIGDVIIDGGNSHYTDTLRIKDQLYDKGIRFVDIGVSGGPDGARNGACLMIGGSEAEVLLLKPVIEAVADAGAWKHLGTWGAGHFAKMVHNGIEYGMMQAIGEGAAVLRYSEFNYNLADVFDLYNKRSVIESRLVGWVTKAFKENPQLDSISSTISASGEGAWTVEAAKSLHVDAPIIEGSLKIRTDSPSVDPASVNGFRNKVVSALRGQFGGHNVTEHKK